MKKSYAALLRLTEPQTNQKALNRTIQIKSVRPSTHPPVQPSKHPSIHPSIHPTVHFVVSVSSFVPAAVWQNSLHMPTSYRKASPYTEQHTENKRRILAPSDTRNEAGRSRNHSCHEKVLSIKHYTPVCTPALFIRHANCSFSASSCAVICRLFVFAIFFHIR